MAVSPSSAFRIDESQRKTAIDVLAAGETMSMVAPEHAESASEAQTFRMDAGGAESNVASHVAALGLRAQWHSRVGSDALGERLLKQVAARGVDVSTVTKDPARPTGLYVKDPGRGVHYFRAGSAASALGRSDARDLTFDGVRVFHISGITAALSQTAAEFLDEAIDRARAAGTIVSFDVNYRPRLWDAETASHSLGLLVRRAGVVFVGRDEAGVLWGCKTDDDVRALFPDVPELVVKDDSIGATSYVREKRVFVPSPVVDVVEAVGAGDAFAGGYLASLLAGAGPRARLEAGHARAALTLRSTADFPDIGMDE